MTRRQLLTNPPKWCAVTQFGTSKSYEFGDPSRAGTLRPAIRAKIGKQSVPAPFFIEVDDATLIGPSALLCADGALLLESVLGDYERLVDASVRSLLNRQLPVGTRLQRPEKRFDEPVFPLVGPWATEYFHWLVDYLTKVFTLERYRDRTGNDPVVLLPPDPPAWLVDSLRFAGVDPTSTIEWSWTRAYCSRVVVGSVRRHVTGGYIHSPAAMERLGERIRGEVGVEADGGSRRLYVSRVDATDRRVLNEGALLDALEVYGFERIVPSEHTFEEQVRRFAEAEVVLGPHGAGLTNAFFSPNATLVELFGSYCNACFFTLTRGMDRTYTYASCRADGPNLVADVDTVVTLVDDLLTG